LEWLTGWVRELVALVLLAGCLELLVPMGSFKKYVRMVMGLLVVVSILNPVLALWRSEIVLDEAVLAGGQSSLPSLEQVQHEARRYRERVLAQAFERLRRQVEETAAAAARAVEGVAGATARATVQSREQGAAPLVERVHVDIVLGGQSAAVRPVDPVRIGGMPERRADGRHPVADAVRHRVAGALGVGPESVTVAIEEAR
jgi:stage III sporulation protein AF